MRGKNVPCLLPNLSFLPRLASLSTRRYPRAPQRGDGCGGLLVALGDAVAAAGLGVRAHHPSQSSGYPSPEFSSCSSSHSARWSPRSWRSVAVTSSARHRPDVTAHDRRFWGQAALEVHPHKGLISPVGGEHRSPPRPGRPPLSLFSRHKIGPRWKFQSRFVASSVISTGAEGRTSPEPPVKVRSTMGDLNQGLPQLPPATLCPAKPEPPALESFVRKESESQNGLG